jgi:hypothetical protein
MTPRKSEYDDDYDDDELEFIEDYSEEELAELYELLGDFPEFDDYLDDLFEYDDEDFYTPKQ